MDFFKKKYNFYRVFLLLLIVFVGSVSPKKLRTHHQLNQKTNEDLNLIQDLLEEAVRQTEDSRLDLNERTKQYLIMIGALYILSNASSKDKMYKNMLGLTLFNYPGTSRGTYFRMALKVFKKLPGVKAKLRAAYSAYSIQELGLARELFQNIRTELAKTKLTEVEKMIYKKLLDELGKE